MSPFSIEKLPDQPVVLSALLAEWNTHRDMETYSEQMGAFFDRQDAPFYYILDFRQVKLGLVDVTLGATSAARGLHAFLGHPNMMEFMAVTNDKLVEMSAKGLNAEVFGFVPVSVYHTTEEALIHVQEKLSVR